jgi:acyl-[acyl-carrier-protein]-phospholipid O-acyltransferase/long-chain-fatty-acid--[acyl-carrier-protein] ligase
MLIVANHPGVLDPVLLSSVMPFDVSVIVSRQAMRNPLCRIGLLGLDAHPADLSDAMTVRRIARLIARGRSVLVFPENRRSRLGAPSKFYEAPAIVAARTAAMVVPINVRYGTVGYAERVHRVTLTVGAPGRIELPTGLPARERRQQATDRLASIMQDAQVAARPRQACSMRWDAVRQQGRRRS